MSAVLTLDNLSVHAGRQMLVSNLSFTLNRGERLGLIGESGSGKSLTALAATGLLPAGLSASGSARTTVSKRERSPHSRSRPITSGTARPEALAAAA